PPVESIVPSSSRRRSFPNEIQFCSKSALRPNQRCPRTRSPILVDTEEYNNADLSHTQHTLAYSLECACRTEGAEDRIISANPPPHDTARIQGDIIFGCCKRASLKFG